jgi:hypothetical protein
MTTIPASGWKFLAWHGACKGTNSICVVHGRTGRTIHVEAVFVATVPGLTRALPVPLGTPATIAGGWRFEVVSVTPNARLDLAPPAGAEDVVVLVKVTNVGGGKNNTLALYDSLATIGVNNAAYVTGCGAKLPPPELSYLGTDVFSGGSVTGTVCWQIARNDQASLELFIGSGVTYADTTWFALR